MAHARQSLPGRLRVLSPAELVDRSHASRCRKAMRLSCGSEPGHVPALEREIRVIRVVDFLAKQHRSLLPSYQFPFWETLLLRDKTRTAGSLTEHSFEKLLQFLRLLLYQFPSSVKLSRGILKQRAAPLALLLPCPQPPNHIHRALD